VVHEDADIDYAVSRILMGAFNNAGQICISVQRVLIHRPVYEQTVRKLLAAVKTLVFGDPRDPATDLGPMIDQEKANEAILKVQEAVSQGARVLCGGKLEGTMFSPTVLADTTPEMQVNARELFCPAISVIPYNDFDEAVKTVNASPYGLQAGIFTRDITRVMQAFSRIEVGGVIVNDIPTYRADQMPYGGMKGSGIGREGPRFAIEEMTEPRLLVINPAGGR
jgi:acyl-CoA reductase-like NAD-dependent aldehyde dehydrogenase